MERINEEEYTNQVLNLCLLAGKIMLQYGAETYRVEDTMMRIAAAFGLKETHSFVTPTGILFSVNDGPTKLVRMMERSTDLEKIVLVNSISRKIAAGKLSLEEASLALRHIELKKMGYPIWLQIVAASVASGCFVIMFQGGWNDFVPAIIAGGLGFTVFLYVHELLKIKFVAEFIASFIIGICSFALVYVGIGHELDKVIIGSVMPLVPGLLITNAVRDLMAGHLVAGLSKGAEAFLTAFAIGAGIAVMFSFL